MRTPKPVHLAVAGAVGLGLLCLFGPTRKVGPPPVPPPEPPLPPSPPIPGTVKTQGAPVPAGRESMAQKIVSAFQAAGMGIVQQATALANAIGESGLNPAIQSTFVSKSGVREESWGLFQLNRVAGLGMGYDVETLKDPDKNIAIIIAEAKKFPSFTGAQTLEEAVSSFVRNVERPKDPVGDTAIRMRVAQKLLLT